MLINLFGELYGPDVIAAFSDALLFTLVQYPLGDAQAAYLSDFISYRGCGGGHHSVTYQPLASC